MKSDILPPLEAGVPPPFHDMDEYRFQHLCKDLFMMEEDISTCNIYGVRGQKQRGIDLIAYREESDGIEVGQCKCTKQFSATDVTSVSDKFFEHWDNWESRDIRRFILFVGCELDRTEYHDEIDKQIKRFNEEKISYDPWDASTIQNKLSPHRELAFRFFKSPDLVDAICGKEIIKETPVQAPKVKSPQIAKISTTQNNTIHDVMENFAKELSPFLKKSSETTLNPDIDAFSGFSSEKDIAGFLRIQANRLLDEDGDVTNIEKLLNSARKFDPDSNDKVLRAKLLIRKGKIDDGLALLNEIEEEEN